MDQQTLSLAEQRKILMELRREQQYTLARLRREDAVAHTPGQNDEYIQDTQDLITGIDQILETLKSVEAMVQAQAQLAGLLRPSAA